MGVLDGLFTGISQGIQNAQNIALQERTNAKNEALMRESWGRDDTAIQRRVADLKAAGLNPALAAGSGADSGSPIRLESPDAGQNPVAAGQVAMNAAADREQKAASISQTQAETERIRTATQGLAIDNKLKAGTTDSQIEVAKANAKKALDTLDASIQLTKAESAKAQAEAEQAASYYYNRALSERGAAFRAQVEQVKAEWLAQNGGQTELYEQELLKAQADAIGAMAAAGVKEMELQSWKDIGVSPGAGNALLAALRLLLMATGK